MAKKLEATKTIAEYIWVGGNSELRSKAKVLDKKITKIGDLPDWGFDGSSTGQAEGHFSDCLLKPVSFFPDPIRGTPHLLVLCEVFTADGKVHPTNTRAHLRTVEAKYRNADAWFGIEQEYTLFKNARPLGFPPEGEPTKPQGPYYCAVGTENIFGRPLVEKHLEACLAARLSIAGINAEVMPGQWEFQVGAVGPLEVSDQLLIARWLLERLGEEYGITVSIAPKPVAGDWNGAGAHTNFSTKEMRAAGGIKAIRAACEKLSKKHAEHIAVYGADNDKRLTGKHETCSIKEFRADKKGGDRGASIRLPLQAATEGRGYLEDRRPAANMDPYKVCAQLMETILGN